MKKLVLISFTSLSSAGGVPRWNRDFVKGFPEAIHYSWSDCPLSTYNASQAPEWNKAEILNAWLRREKKISKDDIFIVDGFWGRGLEDFPNVVSVCHGIWSHLTKDDVDAGKQPDFPVHHAVQIGYRRGHLERSGRLVAVSEFIKHQMMLQWEFNSITINNGIDVDAIKPSLRDQKETPLIIHGVNDKTNPVKGWSHIENLKSELLYCDVMSLDEAFNMFKRHCKEITKMDVLSQADVVVIPSSYEGNSYFLAESLACNVPIVCYDVGLMYETRKNGYGNIIGELIDRRERNKERTLIGTRCLIERINTQDKLLDPRKYIADFSIDRFHREWRDYLEREFSYCI